MRRLAQGFAGHVLEMEGSAARRHPWPAANDLFDLDMDADELAWRNCRACAALARREDQWRAAPPDRVARSGSICLNRRLAPVFRAALASRCVGHRYNQRMNPSAEFPAPEGATLVDCTLERHADQILAIFNDAIATSTALYDYKPRPRESMDTWFQTKQKGGFPVIGFENAAGELMGFASYGTFRAWPAYKYSVEHSVYVDGRHRGLGLGEALMRALIARARERDVHVLVGGIDAANQGSIRLHEKLGFKHAGTLREAGFKFGRWLDLAFYQLTLDTPANPVDG